MKPRRSAKEPNGDVHGAWRAMKELYRDGRVRAIGLSNFYPDRVMDIIAHNQVVPAVNQIELHPFHQQIETQKFLADNGVVTESSGPFAEGKNNIFANELLRGAGAPYGKTSAQVIVRWLIQRGVVAIPKSVHQERIAENFNVLDFELSPEDMAAIATLDTKTTLAVSALGLGCMRMTFGDAPIGTRAEPMAQITVVGDRY